MYSLALFVFVCLLKSSIATEYALATAIPGDEEVVAIDIALDKTTMLTYPGKPDPPQACFEETINFHDFEKHLLAMKIVGKGQCLIKSSNETYEQVKQIVDAIHQGKSKPIGQVNEEWVIPSNALPSAEVMSTVGGKIAKFCTGYKVYNLDAAKVIEYRRDRPDVSSSNVPIHESGVCFVCLSCTAYVKSTESQNINTAF